MVKYGSDKNSFYLYKNYKTELRREDIMRFVASIKRVIAITAPKIKNLSKYLNDIVYICSTLEMAIPWNLPDGAEIKQSYLVEKEKKIPAFFFYKV